MIAPLPHRGRAATTPWRATALLAAALGPASLPGQQLVLRGPDPAVVVLGERAVATAQLLGQRGPAALAPWPALEGLAVAFGEAIASADGAATTWTIELTPTRVGEYALPELVATAGGARFTAPARKLECVGALAGGEHCRLELRSPRASYWQGERFRLVLRLGLQPTFLEQNLIQLFPQQLDVPVQVDVPWPLLPGTVPAAVTRTLPPGLLAERKTMVVGGEVARATAIGAFEHEGRAFTGFELDHHCIATTAGPLHVPPALLRFAFATRFGQDLVRGTVPLDRQQGIVRSDPLDLRIEPLPAAGRPRSFTGAVGAFAVQAEAAPLAVRVGDSLQLRLRIAGDGNLLQFPPPALDAWPLLHVRGRSEAVADGERVITYDLAPRSVAVRAIPAIEFSWFDPQSSSYRTAATQPIPLRVDPAGNGAPLPAADPTAAPPAGYSSAPWLAGLAVGLGLAALLLHRARRRRQGRPTP